MRNSTLTMTNADEVKNLQNRIRQIKRGLNGPPQKCAVPNCKFTSAKADDFRCRTVQGEEFWVCGNCARRLYERGVRTAPVGPLLRAELQTLEKRLATIQEVDIDSFIRDQLCLGSEEGTSLVATRDEDDRTAEHAATDVSRGNGTKRPRRARPSLDDEREERPTTH